MAKIISLKNAHSAKKEIAKEPPVITFHWKFRNVEEYEEVDAVRRKIGKSWGEIFNEAIENWWIMAHNSYIELRPEEEQERYRRLYPEQYGKSKRKNKRTKKEIDTD